MALLQAPMFLDLLEKVHFDTESGCWYPRDDGTYYHGRALYQLVFGYFPENYEPSRICDVHISGVVAPRAVLAIVRCINPFHVEKDMFLGAAVYGEKNAFNTEVV